MKKALLILPMLAGISAAATTDVFDFGRVDSITDGAINITKAVGSNDAPTPSTGDLLNMEGSFTISYVNGGKDVTNGGISPTLASNEEANWKNNFKGTLPFNLADTFADGLLAQTNKDTPNTHPDYNLVNGQYASITLTFSGLQAGTYTLSAFGGYHGQDPMNKLTATLSTTADWTTKCTNATNGTWETEETSTGTSYNFNNSSSERIDHGYALTAKNITVGEGDSLTFTIAGVDGSNNFGRTPLNYVALTQVATVPEPATATLSLLALAGLAMRRRRK